MTLALFVSLAALGAVIGLLAGLLGVGGGMMMVPFMVVALQAAGFPPETLIKIAIATSLSTILFTSISSVRAHHRRGGVRWPIVARLAPGIVTGSLLATQLVHRADSRLLTMGFALFMAWSALRMLRPGAAGGSGDAQRLPGSLGLFAAGAAIGAASAVLGAGGGFLTIPFLSRRGIRIQQAIGSSAAAGFPIAAAGALGYAVTAPEQHVPGAMLGYIWLPALAAIAAASVTTAPSGAALAHRLPVTTLRRIFALLLLVLAIYMMWRAFR
ncbi:MAG: sulfite exporter TauE/SafE family protein [Burkholderiaceae bacterium]